MLLFVKLTSGIKGTCKTRIHFLDPPVPFRSALHTHLGWCSSRHSPFAHTWTQKCTDACYLSHYELVPVGYFPSTIKMALGQWGREQSWAQA